MLGMMMVVAAVQFCSNFFKTGGFNPQNLLVLLFVKIDCFVPPSLRTATHFVSSDN
jgi:hypothetical protein